MKALQPSGKSILYIGWVLLLLSTRLPRIVLQELFKVPYSPNWVAEISAGVAVLGLLATLVWPGLSRLRPFLILYLVFTSAQWLVFEKLDLNPPFHGWLQNPSFNVYMLAEQALNLMVTLVMIATLLLMGKKPADFYLRRGKIDAPAGPVGWLGIGPGARWRSLGAILTPCISLGTLAFLVLAGRPPVDLVIRALPYLPFVILFAATNAFNEEVTYKASFLSVLDGAVGPRHALYMVAAFFGIAHFYGIPYGLVGVALATFLGWILAKSMQETGGLFWAWFIHFWQDVWIFSFLAIGAIMAGGG